MIASLSGFQALLETVGVGLIPMFILVLQRPDTVFNYPQIGTLLHQAGITDAETLIITTGSALLVAYVFKSIVGVGITFAQSRFTERIHLSLAMRLLAAYLFSPYTLHLQRNSSEMVRCVLGEVGIMITSLLTTAFAIVVELLTASLIMALLLSLQPEIAVGTTIFFGIASLVFYRMIRHRISAFGLQNQQQGRLALKWLTQGLTGVKEVKLYGKESFILDHFSSHLACSNRAANNHILVTLLPRYFNELIAVVGVLAATAILLRNDPNQIIPVLAMFAVAATRIIPSLNRLVTAFSNVKYGLPAARSVIADLQSLERGEKTGSDNIPPVRAPKFELLQIKDLRFRYQEGEFEIRIPDFLLHRGQKIAFVGPSGSGKTTIVDLMVGLLKPTGGEVNINSLPIQMVCREWQAGIGYISQSIFLLDDSIRRNVAFGIPDQEIDDVSVWKALDAAQLANYIASLPDGLDSMIGDRGVRLSGGQRQRIGIARALYRHLEVLVLDEGTSALDTVTESQVVQAINNLGPEITVIVVAHRISTVKNCDMIFFVKDGQIVASGSYDQLVQLLPEFSRMVDPLQTQR
ncbi:MAG: ABC transporter ATP-binding protein [Rhodocyclaceae bacterium]